MKPAHQCVLGECSWDQAVDMDHPYLQVRKDHIKRKTSHQGTELLHRLMSARLYAKIMCVQSTDANSTLRRYQGLVLGSQSFSLERASVC